MKAKKVVIWLAVAIVVISGVYIAAKRQVPAGEDYATSTVQEETVAVPMTQWITITIDGNPISVDTYAQNVWYDAKQLTTERPMEITVSDFAGCTMTINGIPITANGTISLQLERIHGYDGIEIYTKNTTTQAESRNYIRTLPVDYQKATILSNDPEDGYYYFNLNNYIYKVDTSGNVVFYKKVEGADAVSGGMDFKRTEVDGKVYYSYLSANTPPDKAYLNDVGYGRSYAVVLDENYNEIDRVLYLLEGEELSFGNPLENHQFTILGEGHYLISGYVGKRVNNFPDDVPHSVLGSRVVANIIQEIKDGKVVWEWDSTDYPELYAMSVENNDYFNKDSQWADYAHFNAIAIDPKDNNFLCSFRNLDAILKLDRTTGEILWVLGGKGDQFGLTEEQKFFRQHDIRVAADGGFTLFNNGNFNNAPQEGKTSIMKFYLNEDDLTVEEFKEYAVENSFSNAMGSAQELEEGHYAVCWGSRVTASALFSEIDFLSGEVLFEFCYPMDGASYRVYKDQN